MRFRAGQKVVCVNAKNNPGQRDWCADDRIVEGEIYTVLRNFIDEDGDNILHLVEVKRSAAARASWGPDVGYGARRFRPVVERKTDISIFTEMLGPQRELALTSHNRREAE